MKILMPESIMKPWKHDIKDDNFFYIIYDLTDFTFIGSLQDNKTNMIKSAFVINLSEMDYTVVYYLHNLFINKLISSKLYKLAKDYHV